MKHLKKYKYYTNPLILENDKWSITNDDSWRELYHDYMVIYGNHLNKIFSICENGELKSEDKVLQIQSLKPKIEEELNKVDDKVGYTEHFKGLDDWFNKLVNT